MSEVTISGKELLQSIRITVKMPRAIGLRLRIASRIVSIAGWLSGTTFAVEIE